MAVSFCTNLNDAYINIEHKHPDLIFLDLDLVDEFGGEFLVKRREDTKISLNIDKVVAEDKKNKDITFLKYKNFIKILMFFITIIY